MEGIGVANLVGKRDGPPDGPPVAGVAVGRLDGRKFCLAVGTTKCSGASRVRQLDWPGCHMKKMADFRMPNSRALAFEAQTEECSTTREDRGNE